MAKTRIADVIVPEVFANYVINRTKELSTLIESGVITQNAELDRLVTGGGKLINMPYWNTLGGTDEILSDGTPLTPDKIDASKDVAALLIRGKAWSANELASALAGSSAMNAIGDQVAKWWALREQDVLISVLNGVFASPTMANHIKDVSAGTGDAANITAEVVLDSKQLLGDAADQLVAIAMHSATYTSLQKQNLIAFIPNSRGEVNIPTYLGYRVVINDKTPVTAGVYTSYMFAAGAIGRGDGIPVDLTPVETDRDSLASDDILINRRAFVLHPFGVKFNNVTVTGATPSNAELALAANWTRVYDDKAVGLVAIKHKVG